MKKNVVIAGKSHGWVHTGIYLKEGKRAKISASGLISFGPFGSWQFPPDGESTRTAQGNVPGPGLTANSLLARAGYTPQYIGSSGELVAERDSALIIAINDDYTHDNDGFWTVFIDYEE